MNLIEHALQEFKYAGWTDESGDFESSSQKDICNNIIELITTFANQGHSDTIIPYVIDIFTKLVKHDILSPLTGDDDEWIRVEDDLYKNKRYSSVFKNRSNEAYDTDAIYFWRMCKNNFTKQRYKVYFTHSSKSRKYITFPYTPVTEYVKYEENKNEVSLIAGDKHEPS